MIVTNLYFLRYVYFGGSNACQILYLGLYKAEKISGLQGDTITVRKEASEWDGGTLRTVQSIS